MASFSLFQLPGQQYDFAFEWNANRENAILIYRDGQLVQNRNIDAPNRSEAYNTGVNDTGRVVKYDIGGLYKIERGGQYTWQSSNGKQVALGDNKVVFRFDDKGNYGDSDGDFDDAVVTVTIS